MKSVARIVAFSLVFLAAMVSSAAELPGAPAGVVADGAGVLTAGDRAKIEALGTDLLRQQGVTVRVVTMAEAGGLNPKTIAVTELNRWGLGQKSVILLILLSPQVVYLQPGTELASYFSEQTSVAICSTLIAPQVRAHAYGAAATAGLNAIRARLLHPVVVSPQALPVRPPNALPTAAKVYDPSAWILALVASMFPAYWILWRVFGRKCAKCGAGMTKTVEVIEEPTYLTGGSAQTVYTCVACQNTENKIFSIGPLSS